MRLLVLYIHLKAASPQQADCKAKGTDNRIPHKPRPSVFIHLIAFPIVYVPAMANYTEIFFQRGILLGCSAYASA